MQAEQLIREHLAAIEARDLDRYAATLAESVTLILPDGRLLVGKDPVVAFHRDWFADRDWSMTTERLSEVVLDGALVVVLAVTYADVDAQGKSYELRYLLSLTAAADATGSWKILHDQNTLR